MKVYGKNGKANIRKEPTVASAIVGTIDQNNGLDYISTVKTEKDTYNWFKVQGGYVREDVAKLVEELDLSDSDKLSENVTIAEFTKSETAKKNRVDNSFVSQEHIDNAKLLCEKIFQPLRKNIGKSIAISSGYRSPKLNKAIGGSTTSQHCVGQAMDIDSSETGINKKYFDYIKNNLDFDQLIWEFGTKDNPDWVHVSYKSKGNRKQVLRAIKKNGKTVYEIWK